MYKQVGDYELKTRIGRGNYADVYLGIHQKTKEQYAIKVISKEKFSHPKLIAGLESEVKIMKEFNHRNILSLKKYFSSANNFYLVMEYCAGGDLNKFIRKIGKLREEHAFNFLTQLAEGIAFLNEHGFIHRDLKTANVLLTEESVRATLKIADFGFARHLQTDALAQTPCGTPLYMAPEVLSAGQYDAKADIWSIGCIFYEMLSGQSPFTGLNEADLLNNIRTKELRAPPDVSSVSVSILKRLLEKTIASRASIQDLLQVCHHISRLSQSQVAQQASSSPSLSHSQTKAAAVAAIADATTLDPNSTAIQNATSDSKNNNNDVNNNNNFDLDIDEDDEEPSFQPPIPAPAPVTAEDTVSPPTVPVTAIPNIQQDTNNYTINPHNNNVANNNNMNNTVSVPTKPSLQLPVDTMSTPTPTKGNSVPTGKGNDNSAFYEDYELVDNTNLSNTNTSSKLQLKTSTKQLSTQPQKSQLAGALSPIPPTPSYIPINNNTNTNTNNATNVNNNTNMKSAAAAIFKTVSSDNTDVASNNPQPTVPNYPSHPVHPQQQSYPWYQLNLLQLAQNNNNNANNNNNNNTNNNSNNAIFGGSSTMYQYQDLYQKNMLQRWEVLGPLVLVMTQVADHWIRHDMLQHNSSNNTNTNNNATNDNIVEDNAAIEDSPFALPSVCNANSSNNTNDKVSGYVVESAEQVAVLLKALALYLHALSLVKTFLLAMDISDEAIHSNNNNNTNTNNPAGVINDTDLGWLVLTRLRQDVMLLFSQLTVRAEQCTFHLSQCTAGINSSNNIASIINNNVPPSQWKATMPKAEALMLQEALLQEQEAEMEELLGKLDRAQKLYEAARHLLVGVLLTFAEENVDLRKQVTFSLKNVVDVLEQKTLSCKERWQVMRREFEPLDE